MSTVAAINITPNGATVVTARAASDKRISLLDMQSIDFAKISSSAASENDSDHSDSGSQVDSLSDDAYVESRNPTQVGLSLSEMFGYEIDSSTALFSRDVVLYQAVNLPFSDQKRVDQVAPLQLQDGLPFEVDEFVVDNQVHGVNQDGSFQIISAILPTSTVSESLENLNSLGAEPRLISSRASILFSLVSRLRLDGLAPLEEGLNAALEVSENKAALVLFQGEELLRLREFSFPGNSALAAEVLASAISSSLVSEEKSRGQRVKGLFVVGPKDVAEFLDQNLSYRVMQLDLSSLLQGGKQLAPTHELSWALGLLTNEILGNPGDAKPVDFRKGPFAYKHALKTLWLAIEPEIFCIAAVVFWVFAWFFSTIYNANQTLDAVENEIQTLLRSKISGETLPRGAEVSSLETKVTELEEQLRGMGSLASLSPLDSLKLLSDVIKENIDIDIDSLSIAQSRLIFRGTILDTPTLGRLDGTLEKIGEPFCSTKVDPKGRDARSSRVKFAAEIELCE
jgi:hypothetical protein